MIENNKNKIFKLDEYKCYRLGLIQAGFFWGIVILVITFYHATITWQNFWGPLLLFIAPFLIILFRWLSYVEIVNGQVVVHDITKTIIAPSDIESVSYQTRSRPSIALMIKYRKGDQTKVKILGADWFNTDTILRMNDALKQLKPDLVISIDEGAQKGMEKRKNLHLKKPKSVIGWIVFLLLWFIVGFAFISVLMLAAKFIDS